MNKNISNIDQSFSDLIVFTVDFFLFVLLKDHHKHWTLLEEETVSGTAAATPWVSVYTDC